jgi:hypothetical protein
MTLQARQPVPQATLEPVPAPRRLRERRLRPLHAAAAVAVMILGALGGGVAVMASSASGEYLALARDVPFGQQLTGADLVTVRVGAPPGLDPVPASDRDEVTGLSAAMPLLRGSLLVPGMLTGQPVPAGQHVVGITVRADRLPTVRPEPGETVQLVATGTDTEATVGTWSALVTAISTSDDGLLAPGRSGVVTLDVAVPAAQAPAVARAAAAGELVVVRTGEGS